MTTWLPDYHQQPQPNQSQMQASTPTGNQYSNNPFLNGQPTGASIQSTATAPPPSFNQAINDTDNRIPTSDPPPRSAQNTSSGSNPFDDLSSLEQHLNTTSTETSHLSSTSTPSGIDSGLANSQTGSNHQAQSRTPSPPISPIEAQSRRSASPPSSPEVQPHHQRPQTPPLIIPPDLDSPPDPSSTTSSTTAVYNPPTEPPPPVSTSTSTPVVYQPPPNPPPRHPHGRTTSNSSSSHVSPSINNGSTQHTWRPTTIPTPGQPLLRNGRILVYPAGFHCPKCQNTGFKKFDPTHPCRKCWEKYSKEFTNAIQSSIGLSGSNLQKPLPIHSPPNHSNYNYSYSQGQGQGLIGRPMSHSNVPGGYPAQSQARPAPGHFQVQQHQTQPYHPNTHYRPPISDLPPPQQQQQSFRPGPPAVNRADSASEGLDGDAPPNYNEVVTSNRPLPPQSTGSSSSNVSGNSFRPPPVPPPVPQHHGSSYGPPQGFHQSHQQGYGYGHPGHHQHQHHPPHHQPPPRPLVLQPGDPRIGGQLCYKCGGRGLKESFWFGDETCFLCNGMGRTFR